VVLGGVSGRILNILELNNLKTILPVNNNLKTLLLINYIKLYKKEYIFKCILTSLGAFYFAL
jgi:hypothetical protein